jgi:uncharacterized cupredoxin-like copper-binding protein
MARNRPGSLTAVFALALLAVVGCGSSSSTSNTTAGGGGGVTVPSSSSGTTVDVVVSDAKGLDGPMTLTATPDSVPAGDVTFTVKNEGTIDHEVVVLKTDTPYDQLPVGASEPDRVDETNNVGETGEPDVKPGETRSFTVNAMSAGKYVLVCNIAKHYAMGMRAPFTVT